MLESCGCGTPGGKPQKIEFLQISLARCWTRGPIWEKIDVVHGRAAVRVRRGLRLELPGTWWSAPGHWGVQVAYVFYRIKKSVCGISEPSKFVAVSQFDSD